MVVSDGGSGVFVVPALIVVGSGDSGATVLSVVAGAFDWPTLTKNRTQM